MIPLFGSFIPFRFSNSTIIASVSAVTAQMNTKCSTNNIGTFDVSNYPPASTGKFARILHGLLREAPSAVHLPPPPSLLPTTCDCKNRLVPVAGSPRDGQNQLN